MADHDLHGQEHAPDPHAEEAAAMPVMQQHAMIFHFGVTETILFGFWKTESALGIFISCVVIVLACFGLESLRSYRLDRKRKFNLTTRCSPTSSAPQLGNSNGQGQGIQQQYSKGIRLMMLSMDAGMHAVQLTISYLLMLIFMTFNGWLCVAILFGEVAAHFVLNVLYPQLETSGDRC